MASIDPLSLIENDTPADATPVRTNFDLLESFVNVEVVHADGSINMTVPLTLPSSGTADNHAATVGQIASSPAAVPTGSILDFAGASAPAGYVMCDGRAYSSTDPAYQALFAVIGAAYGGDNGNFKVPDFTGNRLAVAASSGDFARGKTGGARSGVAEHSHVVPKHKHGNDLGVSDKPEFSTQSEKDDHQHAWSGDIKNNLLRMTTGAPISEDAKFGKQRRILTSNNNQVIENGRMSSNGAAFVQMPTSPVGGNQYVPAISTQMSVEYEDATTVSGKTSTVAATSGVTGFGHVHMVEAHNHGLTGGVQDKPEFNTKSTGDVGDTNYPPYVAVNKIIRL